MLADLEDSNTFLKEITPEDQLTRTIVFDIPKKTKPFQLLLQFGAGASLRASWSISSLLQAAIVTVSPWTSSVHPAQDQACSAYWRWESQRVCVSSASEQHQRPQKHVVPNCSEGYWESSGTIPQDLIPQISVLLGWI